MFKSLKVYLKYIIVFLIISFILTIIIDYIFIQYTVATVTDNNNNIKIETKHNPSLTRCVRDRESFVLVLCYLLKCFIHDDDG